MLYTILRPAHGELSLRVKRKAVYALVPTGNPSSQSSDTLMSLRAIPLSLGLGALCPSSAPAGGPVLAELGHPDVASGRDSYAGGSLNRCEAHPVLARQLRVRLHKALRSRTRGTENAYTLITHRLKQAQQLRGHVGCRQ